MGKSVIINGVKTSIANQAMLIFAKEYAELHWYLEGWTKQEEDFWGNAYDRMKNPDAPEVIRVNYVLPVLDDEKEARSFWEVPRVKIDSYWGHPRINIVDKERNFCCLSYDRDANTFKEAQVWGKDGFDLAVYVKAGLERIIRRLEQEYGG